MSNLMIRPVRAEAADQLLTMRRQPSVRWGTFVGTLLMGRLGEGGATHG